MKKIRIGIITFHDAYSYGATMQCLGLQLFLRNKEYDPYVIDYSMQSYMEYRNKHKIGTILKKVNKVLKNPIGMYRVLQNKKRGLAIQSAYERNLKERNKLFHAFWEKWYQLDTIRYTKMTEIKRNPPKFDVYVCGSDQIWNPNFQDFDSNYFLDFAPKNKRISYAPSFGVSKIDKKFKNELKKRVNDIPYLSVRENTGEEILRQMGKKDVPIVIDPTFLVSDHDWRMVAKDSKLDLPKDYILTYFIGMDAFIEQSIEKIKLMFKGYEVINLVFDQTSYGPSDFLNLIDNAGFVLTNSFHGMAFCINFNTPFAVIKTLKDYTPGAAFDRMESLLKNLNLSDRILENIVQLDESMKEMTFDESNILRKQIVEKSEKFLVSSIDDIVNREKEI